MSESLSGNSRTMKVFYHSPNTSARSLSREEDPELSDSLQIVPLIILTATFQVLKVTLKFQLRIEWNWKDRAAFIWFICSQSYFKVASCSCNFHETEKKNPKVLNSFQHSYGFRVKGACISLVRFRPIYFGSISPLRSKFAFDQITLASSPLSDIRYDRV